MRTIGLGLTLGVAMLAGVGIAQAQRVVKVGGADIAPYVVHAPSGALGGIAVDLAEAIAKDAGFKIEYLLIPGGGDGQVAALTSGQIDMILSDFVATAQRKQSLDFSSAYRRGAVAAVLLKSDQTSYETLANVKGTVVGSGYPPLRERLRATGYFSDIRSYDTAAASFQAVSAGDLKAAIAPDAMAAALLNRGFADLRWMNTDLPGSDVVIAVRKGDDTALLGKINASLEKLIADGSVKAIFAKYDTPWTLNAPKP